MDWAAEPGVVDPLAQRILDELDLMSRMLAGTLYLPAWSHTEEVPDMADFWIQQLRECADSLEKLVTEEGISKWEMRCSLCNHLETCYMLDGIWPPTLDVCPICGESEGVALKQWSRVPWGKHLES